MKVAISILFMFLIVSAQPALCQDKMNLVDDHATQQTKNLYYNLIQLSQNHILFGHQHATQYGHGWQGDENRSDVKSVTGSHPAVIGVDFSGLSGRADSLIEKEKRIYGKQLKILIIVAALQRLPGIFPTRFQAVAFIRTIPFQNLR